MQDDLGHAADLRAIVIVDASDRSGGATRKRLLNVLDALISSGW
jgi:hypothetical protein